MADLVPITVVVNVLAGPDHFGPGVELRLVPAARFQNTGHHSRAEAAGDTPSLIVVPDTGHVELVAPGTAAFELQADVLATFVHPQAD